MKQVLADFGSKVTVETSLETVIFEDGVAQGSDATNATQQVQAYLDAERVVADHLNFPDAAAKLDSLATLSHSEIMDDPPRYQDSLAYYKETLAQLYLKTMHAKSINSAARLADFERNVANKRGLNIVLK